MKDTFFDRIPTNLPGGFFVYRATGDESLCFADKNVLELFECETMDEFRTVTGNSFFYVFIVNVEKSEYQELNHPDWETRIGYQQTEKRSRLTGLIFEKAFYSACEQNLSNVKVN